ncbi:hypothetical protein GmHk_18G051771 [Glycine max]|nr:hypothetical protein GmHk_18G051771 [Glycine max]
MPSLYDRTTKLEETLAQFMQVSMSNQKSTESAIKNLEVQLAERPSSSFTANTEKNPKEDCKAVMTRSKMLADEPALEPVDDLVELEESVEEAEGDEEEETPIRDYQDRIKKKEEKEKEKDEEIKEEEEKEKKWHLRKGRLPLHLPKSDMIDLDSPLKKLGKRNVIVYYTKFDEFKEELERRHWDEELTSFTDDSIDVAIVKEFYANLYDPEDKSPKQVRVRGHLVKFDEDTLNTFLKTLVILEEGENLCAYSRFALLRPDPQELAAKLCIPGRGFKLNVDGQPLKILRKNMTTLAQTWSVLSFSNLIPTSHTSDVTLDRAKLIYGIIMKMDMNVGYLISHQISITAQHDSSRLGFPALITALCKARGVQSDSRSLESLSSTINLAYI